MGEFEIIRFDVFDEDTSLWPAGRKINLFASDAAGFVKAIEFNKQKEVIAGILKEPVK